MTNDVLFNVCPHHQVLAVENDEGYGMQRSESFSAHDLADYFHGLSLMPGLDRRRLLLSLHLIRTLQIITINDYWDNRCCIPSWFWWGAVLTPFPPDPVQDPGIHNDLTLIMPAFYFRSSKSLKELVHECFRPKGTLRPAEGSEWSRFSCTAAAQKSF